MGCYLLLEDVEVCLALLRELLDPSQLLRGLVLLGGLVFVLSDQVLRLLKPRIRSRGIVRSVTSLLQRCTLTEMARVGQLSVTH
jgi:hypothetical protein